MAITSVLGGQGRVSDATLTAMLNSGDQNLINQANNYIEGAKKEAEELGKNKGILGTISDLFGFSKLAAAEPDMPNKQKFSQQFSVTQPPQFEMKPEVNVPGNINMAGSVFANYPYLDQEVKRINQILSPEEQLQLFLNQEGGDAEIDVFKNRNIFQKSFDFLKDNPEARFGLGALIGGPVGALAGFFANRIGGGIMNAINNFRNRGKDVEIGLPQVIQTGSEFVDEFAPSNDPGTVGGSSRDSDTGGTFGTSTNDASTFSDYS